MEKTSEVKQDKPNAKNLVATTYIVCALTMLCGIIYFFYGIVYAYLSLSTAGAPDAQMISTAIKVIMWGQFFMLPLQIACLVCERLLVKRVRNLRPPLWYSLLIAACISFICISVFNLPLSIILLVRLFAKRRFYFGGR